MGLFSRKHRTPPYQRGYDPESDPLIREAQEHAVRINELMDELMRRTGHPLGDLARGTIAEGVRNENYAPPAPPI